MSSFRKRIENDIQTSGGAADSVDSVMALRQKLRDNLQTDKGLLGRVASNNVDAESWKSEARVNKTKIIMKKHKKAFWAEANGNGHVSAEEDGASSDGDIAAKMMNDDDDDDDDMFLVASSQKPQSAAKKPPTTATAAAAASSATPLPNDMEKVKAVPRKATAAAKRPRPNKRARKAGNEDSGDEVVDVNHKRHVELCRQLYQSSSITALDREESERRNGGRISAACSLRQGASAELTFEQRAEKYAGCSLDELLRQMVERAVQLGSGDDDEERHDQAWYEAKVREELDAELHYREHAYWLGKEPPGQSVQDRFKAYIGVRAGAVQNEIEAEIREQYPNERRSAIQARVKARMRAIETEKKATYQQYVSDDKMRRILLREYVQHDDEEAGEIYRQFQRHIIDIECCREPEERERRLADVERLLAARKHEGALMREAAEKMREATLAANRLDGNEVGSTEDVVPRDIGKRSELEVARVEKDAKTGAMRAVSHGGKPLVEDFGVRPASSFVSAYKEDMTRSAEQVLQSHCEGLMHQLFGAINLTAQLVMVAPRDSVFAFDENEAERAAGHDTYAPTGHPVTDMLRILGAVGGGYRVDAEQLTRYMEQWTRTKQESPEDINVALVAQHTKDELRAIRKTFATLGVPEERVRADLAYAVPPSHSKMMRAIVLLTDNEEFQKANRSAMEQTRLKERLAEDRRNLERRQRRREREQAAEAAATDGRKARKKKMPPALEADEADIDLTAYENAARKLEVCEKAYNADFLRESAGAEFFEYPCVRGEACEGMTMRAPYPSTGTADSGRGFVLREFLLPSQLSQQRDAITSGRGIAKLPRQMCLLCNRHTTTALHASFSQQRLGVTNKVPLMLIQNHCNIIDREGEYTGDVALPVTSEGCLFTGIVRPFVRYNKNHYVPSRTMRNSYLGGPRTLPFLPLLPPESTEYASFGRRSECDHGAWRAADPRPSLDGSFERQFTALADADICLKCASPYELNCGFSNWAFTYMQSADGHQRNWSLEMFTCECEQCEEATTESIGDSDAQDADLASRLMERHRFSKLDAALGVDEPLELVERRVANEVPVLNLRKLVRRALLARVDDPDCRSLALLGVDADCEQLYDNVFCSFTRTTIFVASSDGREAFRRVVLERRDWLRNNAQLHVPQAAIDEPEVHVIYRALLLRVATAYDFIVRLPNDLRHEYETNPLVQRFVLNAQLFADTHLDLALHCDVMGAHNDHYMTTPMQTFILRTEFGEALAQAKRREAERQLMSECIKFSALDRCYPHPLRAVYAGEMIDLSCSVQQSNVWTAVRTDFSTRTSSFIHMFMCKSANHKCVADSTQVALASGLSVPIKDLAEGTLLAVAVPGEAPRESLSPCFNVVSTGTKDCVRLTLEDGRTLDVTADHRLLQANGEWIEAKDVSVAETRLAVAARVFVEDVHDTERELPFALDAGCYHLTMTTHDARNKTLAFFRLLGISHSDGWISGTTNSASACVGHVLDRDAIVRDASLFDGCSHRTAGGVIRINFRAKLAAAFRAVSGSFVGRRIGGQFLLPQIIMAEDTPRSVVREYVAALFGGDGVGPVRLRMGDKQDDCFSHVYIMHLSLERNVADMQRHMRDLRQLLTRCGVNTASARVCTMDARIGDGYTAKDGLLRKEVRLQLTDTLSFADRVGFRYCNQKQMRLAAACVWMRRYSIGMRQRASVLCRMLEIREQADSARPPVGTRKRGRLPTWDDARVRAQAELGQREAIVAHDMLPKGSGRKSCRKRRVEAMHRAAEAGTAVVRGVKKFDVLAEIGCGDWFDGSGGYISGQLETTLPTMALRVIDSRPLGPKPVYDLSAPEHETFFANGVSVHNCLVRGFDDMMSVEIGKQPVLSAMLMNLLELTMLGNYPGPRVRPLWTARMAVRRSHHWDRPELHTWCTACHKEEKVECPRCGRQPPKRDSEHNKHRCDMCEYIKKNKFLVFFAIKEFYVYTVQAQGVINSMLEQEGNWIEHWRMLFKSLDDARRTLSQPFDDVAAITRLSIANALFRVADHLTLAHDVNKPSMRRRHKSVYFFGLLQRKMSRIHNGNYVVRKVVIGQQVVDAWTGYQRPQDFLLAPLHREAGSEEVLPENATPPFTADEVRRYYACNEPLAHLGGKRWCDVYTLDDVDRLARFCARQYGDIVPTLLSQVGMSPAGHKMLLEMHYNSEMRDMPDNQLIKNCVALLRNCAVDFHLLHYFLWCMERYHAVGISPLDRDQALAQARALRLRHHIEPWEELPLDCDRVWVCRNERRAFCDIVAPAEYEEHTKAEEKDGSALSLDKDVFTRGVVSAYYDHRREGLVCSKFIDSSNARSWYKLDVLRALRNDDLPLALSIRLARETQRECEASTLESFSLLGGVLRIGKTAITLCVKCGAVCTWQEACMTTEGMTCGREVRFVESGRYTNLLQFVTPLAQQVRQRTDTDLHPVRETLLVPPLATGGREDLCDRITTPIFDMERCYDKLALLNLGVGVGYALAKSDGAKSEGAKSESAKRARVDVSVGNKTAYGVDFSHLLDNASERQKERFVASASHRANARAAGRRRDKSGKTRESQLLRDAKFAERHRVRPDHFVDADWEATSDRDKMFLWTDEGLEYIDKYRELRMSDAVDKDKALLQLELAESARRSKLIAERFYELELNRRRCQDAVAEALAREKRRFSLDALTDKHALQLRASAISMGALQIRVEIVCAYCMATCDPRGQYRRLIVENLDGCLMQMRTGERLENRGLVHIYLCKKHFENCAHFLKTKPLPRVTDIILHLDARRQHAMQNHLAHHTRY